MAKTDSGKRTRRWIWHLSARLGGRVPPRAIDIEEAVLGAPAGAGCGGRCP